MDDARKARLREILKEWWLVVAARDEGPKGPAAADFYLTSASRSSSDIAIYRLRVSSNFTHLIGILPRRTAPSLRSAQPSGSSELSRTFERRSDSYSWP